MLRVFIVDDEDPARKRLVKMLKPYEQEDRIKIVGQARDGVETLDFFKENEADLLLLDIRMPEIDGFGVLERLPVENRPIVIFTTAYDEYALKAFDANATDYLLKPIAKGRLQKAIEKGEHLFRASTHARQMNEERLGKLLDWLEDQEATAKPQSNTASQEFMSQISIPYRDRILVVPVEHLVSAEILEGITRLCILVDQQDQKKERIRQHIVNYTLEQLEDYLDPGHFMRVHRSAIVCTDHIREMIPWFSGRYKLILSGNHEVISSRERSKLLKERLMVDLKK